MIPPYPTKEESATHRTDVKKPSLQQHHPISGPKLLSPFWVVLFYFTMILFGLAQQMALVHTVASGLIAIRPDHFLHFESSLTFMSCLLGLVFSFPMATEVCLSLCTMTTSISDLLKSF